MGARDTFDLVCSIGNSRFRANDIRRSWVRNRYVRPQAIKNTVALLAHVDLLVATPDGVYSMSPEVANYLDTPQGFVGLFQQQVLKNHPGLFLRVIPLEALSFNERTGQYHFYRNSVLFEYSGIFNCLVSFGLFNTSDNGNIVRIHDSRIVTLLFRDVVVPNKGITPERLKAIMRKKEKAGDASELLALEYEKRRLNEIGVTKSPHRVSLLDAAKGYDIASYESSTSEKFDRFIEVKTFSSQSFYMSKNEIWVANILREKYHLYLVSKSVGVEVIRDPYPELHSPGLWAQEPVSFRFIRVSPDSRQEP